MMLQFADDNVLVHKTKEDLSRKLDNWWETFKRKGFKINCTKKKYIIYNFGHETQEVTSSMMV